MSRGNQPPQNTAPTPVQNRGRRKHIDWQTRTVRIELFILLVGCALLLGAVSLYLGFSGTQNSQADTIDKFKYQAVFLNGGFDFNIATGQPIAYFGKVTSINNKYLVLQDVYYLTASQQAAQNNQTTTVPQLVKLGCQQLHSPYDQMFINQNQVAYWENLKDDGKVVKAIKEFQKANPNGPKCDNQNTNTQTDQPVNSDTNQTQ